MSHLFRPPPGQLFASLLFNKSLHSEEEVLSLWTNKWGNGEVLRPSFNPMMKYYGPEMGGEENLQRLIVLSNPLVEREILVDSKLWSVEKEYQSNSDKRSINIDPGLMTLENIILGTGKIYGHRPYLGKGVYADLNLLYVSGSYSPLEWTYPDYKEKEVISFFNHWRNSLHSKLKAEGLDSYNTRH